MVQEFMARSGRKVQPLEDGSVRFEHGNGYIGSKVAMDAEEFFQAKRDGELGRWRSRVNPSYVVYQRDDGFVRVIDETTGAHSLITRDDLGIFGRSTVWQVAREFFAAHPVRQPWLYAEYGEVWEVTRGEDTQLYRVNSVRRFEQVSGTIVLDSVPVGHESITDARKVWPVEA